MTETGIVGGADNQKNTGLVIVAAPLRFVICKVTPAEPPASFKYGSLSIAETLTKTDKSFARILVINLG
jgi:hypothetical protein